MSPYTSSIKPAAYPIPTSYPSPAQSEPHVEHRISDQGLGLYDCSPFAAAQARVSALPPSPQPSEVWSRPVLSERAPQPQSSSRAPPPDIFSAAYDPFAYAPSPSFEDSSSLSSASSSVPELASSPSASGTRSSAMSSRSSFSSFAAHDAYSHRRVDNGLGRIHRAHGSPSWLPSQAGDVHLQGSLGSQDFLGISSAPYGNRLESQALDTSSDWSGYSARAGSEKYDTDSYSNYGERHDDRSGEKSVITNVQRTRKRRQLTTPADANHECHKCGKLFGRSYNYKAHMETHDPTRIYAYPCTEDGCSKKFVRKTDLTRHHQSVHMKQRNYQCELCGNMFARKDTLRRHTEDGCSKRFEIASKAFRTPDERMTAPTSMPIRTSPGLVPMRMRQVHGDLAYSTSPASDPGLPSLSRVGIYGKQEYTGINTDYCW
ncbi:MAG: hypothetical protein M1825_000380 [Sarcosagium campestre]|nr:MAG: hypothetical protein M1825_000380 [Sarcosagium campestre]